MQELASVVDAYRTFDPARWVAVYRMLPTWLGIAFVVLGVLLLLFGGGRMFRVVAGPAGALVGYLWVPVLISKFGVGHLPPAQVSAVAAIALAILGFAFPPAIVFVAVGLPAGFAAGAVAGTNDWMLGFLPGFLAIGTIAAVFTRYIGSVVSSVVGGWILVLGALAALHQAGGVVAAVARQPWGVLLAAGLFAVAGIIYQVFVKPSPEEAERLRVERARARQKLEEKRALEKRWGVSTRDD